MDGMEFADSDACFKAMHAHGYGTPYFGRNTNTMFGGFENTRRARRAGIACIDPVLGILSYTNGQRLAAYRLRMKGYSKTRVHRIIQAQRHAVYCVDAIAQGIRGADKSVADYQKALRAS